MIIFYKPVCVVTMSSGASDDGVRSTEGANVET
jgi:hypothetical protein